MFLLIAFIFSYFQPSDTIAVKGEEVKGFENAVSVAADGKGFLYVLDSDKNEVLKLDSNLNLLKRAGGPGSGSLQFYYPTFIDASSGLDLFVSDGRNFRVQRLDLNLAFISELRTDTKTFTEELRFKTPLASVVVNSNDLYVIDEDNKRIVIYPKGAAPNNYFAGYKEGNGKLISPVKIQKDNNNFIYVLDREKGILKYDNFGNYISVINYLPHVITFSVYSDNLYILTENEIFIYNSETGTFKSKVSVPGLKSYKEITDFLVYSSEKYLLLEKNRLSYWNINNR